MSKTELEEQANARLKQIAELAEIDEEKLKLILHILTMSFMGHLLKDLLPRIMQAREEKKDGA